jgi:hypothetical protein
MFGAPVQRRLCCQDRTTGCCGATHLLARLLKNIMIIVAEQQNQAEKNS